MSLPLTDDQTAIRDLARRFSRERLLPDYQKREAVGELDRDLVREMGGLGLIGADLPEKHGGLGVSGVTSGLIIEEIAYGDINVSYVNLMASLIGQVLSHHAAPQVQAEWVPAIVKGEKIVGLGLTEPRGGSDAANLILSAKPARGGYVLNGEKTSISFAHNADAAVIWARSGTPEQGARGISAFMVDLNQKGVTRTKLDDIGTTIVGRGSLFFDDVFVPAEHRLAEEGDGFVQVMQGFDFSRALIGLQTIAPAQASLDEAWEYAKERQAFGAPIAQYQGVSFPLAEAETYLTMARQLCYHALDLRDRNLPHTAEAAMCKWYCPKVACEVIHQCLLTQGHYGYVKGSPHQQRYRDVLGLQIGDGTAQIMKLIIAREKVGRLAVQYLKKSDKRPS